MPTRREREYYAAGYRDGLMEARRDIGRDFGYPSGEWRSISGEPHGNIGGTGGSFARGGGRRGTRRRKTRRSKPRALSKWQKFVKTNSKKKEFRFRNGKVNLKKLGVAYRKKHGKRKR